MITAGLTESEEQQIVALLAKVKQPWSQRFYNALAPMVRMTTTDLVLIDENNRVFITQRPVDDAFEPGFWHFPGTVTRPTDISIADSLERIGKNELGLSQQDYLLTKIKDAGYLCERFSNSKRGPEINRYYVCSIDSRVDRQIDGIGKFVNTDEFIKLKVLRHHTDIDIWSII